MSSPPASHASRAPFGARLAEAMDTSGPLCLGIDPHPQLLADWDLPDTPVALERFSQSALEAAMGSGPRPLVAAIKPQVALYERHGSAGVAVLERLLAAARSAGVLTIADAKRGDIGSTMAGYAHAWLSDSSPLAADAVTLSPYLGYGSLAPAIELAESAGRGVFVLALTSNPEGASVQHAAVEGLSVARAITEAAAADNARYLTEAPVQPEQPVQPVPPEHPEPRAGARSAFGPVGLVVGATVAGQAAALGIDLAGVCGALLAPGFGAQGASAAGMRAGFAAAWPAVLATSSRAILRQGPSIQGLRQALTAARDELTG